MFFVMVGQLMRILKHRKYSGLLLDFGTTILYETSAKVEGGIMESRWEKGVWLGKRFGIEEHIVSRPDGTGGDQPDCA